MERQAIEIYALVDNYNYRRKAPVAIFGTYNNAEDYAEKLIEIHEEKGESYYYNIKPITIDLASAIMAVETAVNRKCYKDRKEKIYATMRSAGLQFTRTKTPHSI